MNTTENESKKTSPFEELMKLVSSHGDERTLYAISVAFHAAEKYLEFHRDEFTISYGTEGVKLVKEFSTR